MNRQLPFTILTGFLGAGKTTLLNRLLRQPRRRLAVLVNDLGRINVDRQLLTARDGDIIELSGGCVCCQVDLSRDLWTAAADLVVRAQPEQIVLETTGIADPSVLLASIDEDKWPKHNLGAVGVVCVVDGVAGPAELTRAETRGQVLAADRLLLSKLDVATVDQVAALHATLDSIGAKAPRASFPQSTEADALLGDWALETVPRRERRTHLSRHHHGQVNAVTLVDDTAHYLEAPLTALLSSLPGILRAKGFVRLAGQGLRFVELAGGVTKVLPSPVPAQRTELVLIGEGLDESDTRGRLWACRAAGS
jgi:G3E family GTPase